MAVPTARLVCKQAPYCRCGRCGRYFARSLQHLMPLHIRSPTHPYADTAAVAPHTPQSKWKVETAADIHARVRLHPLRKLTDDAGVNAGQIVHYPRNVNVPVSPVRGWRLSTSTVSLG